jgi:uncharacterized membrane protein SpoIIM required for sporulation
VLHRDASSTGALIICGTIGESSFPVIVGWAMEKYGYSMFPLTVAGLNVTLIVCYLLAHSVGTGLLHDLLHNRRLRFKVWKGEEKHEMAPLLDRT